MKKAAFIIKLVAVLLIVGVVVLAGFLTAENGATGTAWALLAPVVAIALALITKEVYSSLFIGVVIGALLCGQFSFAPTMDAIVNGLVEAVAGTRSDVPGDDSSGIAAILIFLVILGVIVALINRSGASQAFGRWAQTHIKTRVGAALATFALGVLIFIDDYFNCLTVGTVMQPVTDAHKISRVKLAYLIDATAAPVCMIAPVSSWAAAVSSNVESSTMSGIELFVRAIPFNFYSLLTLVFVIAISIMGFDYGKMSGFEIKARETGDTGAIDVSFDAVEEQHAPAINTRGRVIDLIFPTLVLIVSAVIGLLYAGGFFTSYDFVGAFGDTDAGTGLSWGGLFALVVIIVYMLCRRVVSFKDAMDCIPRGFMAMVPAILILTLATALKNMTGALGAAEYVKALMESSAEGLAYFLPAIIFLVACGLAFATGTSWGTFGILIPIVTSIYTEADPLMFVGVSACLAGAVCGDHCSPISDTTIMSSAGAQCNHVDHVSTQLPYALTVAAISFVCYLLAAFIPNAWIMLPIGIVLTVGTLFVIRAITRKKA